jgi:hypothetical protein
MNTNAARVAARSGVIETGEDKSRSSESLIVSGNPARRHSFDQSVAAG